jgi:hypothetical protein
MTVTPENIGTELGVAAPTVLQAAQWSSWIDQALFLIGKRLDVSTLDPKDVDYVVLQAVVEHARNPRNETQVAVSVDDGSVSRSLRSGAGKVVITDDLWRILDPALDESGVGSTQMYGAPDAPAYDPWVGA